ncbi:MAG: cellulose biosynthesis cyclic di-GMP-binding regulatory protein BcsB [Anaerolineales bacterium]
MKTMPRLSLIVLSLVVFLTGFAAAPAAAPLPQQAVREANISFALLGQTDQVMNGPYASLSMIFSTPANWAFRDGAELQLVLGSQVATESGATIQDGQYIGATMTVTLDKNAISTLPLVAGPAVPYLISIPASALVSPYDDGHHQLSLFLNAGLDCDRTLHRTSVIVSATSQFTLPYDEVAPITDLTLLPRPLYQRNSVFPVPTFLVVPDAPSTQEMQAAFTVAAAFGRLTSGNQPLELLPISSLGTDLRNSSNLILLGKSSFLSTVPAPWSDNVLVATAMLPDDGRLQLAISPWNPARAALIVTGSSDAGVVKAAQALSNNNIQTSGRSDLAVVAEVGPASLAADQNGVLLPLVKTHTFAELGYGVVTVTGAGSMDSFFKFVIPPGMVADNDTYLDLTFDNSPAADLSASDLSVYVNGKPIGGAPLTDQTSSATTQRIRIPLSVLLPGSNQLRIQATLVPLTLCSSPGNTNLWLSILPESVLSLPLKPAPVVVSADRDLSKYPYPFANQPTLSNLAFVIPKDDPLLWNQAAQIAYGIGRGSSGAIFDLAVAYDGELNDPVRQGRDMIVLGLPTNLKFAKDALALLPAPFEPGSNTAVISGQQVSYRFPPDISLGYLELLPSPWSADHTALLVSGTNANGINFASGALTNSTLLAALKGNLAIIDGKNVTVLDTRTGLGLSALAADNRAQPAPATPAVPASSLPVSSTNQHSWILTAIAALLVLIAIVVLIALLQMRAARRAQ